jgi:hypothetical protein
MMKRLHVFFLLFVAFALGAGCSSDPNTPLGSSFVEDSLIQSRPGEVFQDTIFIGSTDSDFTTNRFYNAFLTEPTKMLLGRADDFETTMLVRVNFSPIGEDTAKTVTEAELVLRVYPTQSTTLGALFFALEEPFFEGDTLTSIQMEPTPIPDAGGVHVDRLMQITPNDRHTLPVDSVQNWIQAQTHNGIAVVLNDPTTSTEMTFGVRENEFDGNTNTPFSFLEVDFSDDSSESYRFLADGTFSTDLLAPTAQLRLSDGDTRRIYMPLDLSVLPDSAVLHNAQLVMYMDPTATEENIIALNLYAPEDSIIGSEGILKGEPDVTVFVGRDSTVASQKITFPVRDMVQLFINDSGRNHGLVLRYLPEGNTLRRAEFFSSSAVDSIRPFVEFTFSTPPTFPGGE